MVLIAELRSLSNDEPAVVQGVLAALFAAKLPAAVAARQHDKTVEANSLCFVAALEVVSAEQLQQLGILMGDALMIMRVITEQAGAAPPVAVVSHQQQQQVTRRTGIRPFPEVADDGFS